MKKTEDANGGSLHRAGSAIPLDDMPPTKECDCEFTPDPDEPGVESVHYLRRCQKCKATWWSLHCPHDGIQGRCSCGERGRVWPNDKVSRPAAE